MNKDIRYGKLTDETLDYAPRVLLGEHGESIITGGDDADLYLAHGYKPIIYAQPPSEEGFTYTPSWTEDGEHITRVWTETPIPEDETEDMQAALELLGVTAGEAT